MNLILGVGFLSQYILRCAPRIAKNWGVNRSGEDNALEANGEIFQADVLVERSLEGLSSRISDFDGYVFYLIPPSSFGDRPIDESLSPLFKILKKGFIRGVAVISSTGVFSEFDGAVVNHSTAVIGTSSRVQRLLEIENAWLASPFQVAIVRLAGLYGNSRIIGARLLEGERSLPGDGNEYINLIHGYDAARAVLKLLQNQFFGEKFLVTDGNPVKRKVYYNYLASRLGVRKPKFSGKKRNSYQCDSSETWRRLKASPEFGDYRVGLERSMK